MGLLSLLTRNRERAPRPLPVIPRGYDLEGRLAYRRIGRAERNERARQGAATKQHQAFAQDRLRNEQVQA